MTYSLAQVRAAIRNEFRILAEELEAQYATRDTNDGSTYCSNCGGPQLRKRWRHDPECLVTELRNRSAASLSSRDSQAHDAKEKDRG